MTRLGIWVAGALVVVGGASALSAVPAASAADDVTPPVIDTVTGPPAFVTPSDGSATLSYSWSGHDPEGSAVTYDVRLGLSSGADEPPVWGAPRSVDDYTVFGTGGRAGESVCFQVRAVDSAGNTSEWVGPTCTYVDAGPPWMDQLDARPPYEDHLATSPVRYAYRASDDDRVASYDVKLKVAPSGQLMGGWTSPAAWQAVTGTSVSHIFGPGSEVCFRARARDRAGNVGSYELNDSCTTIPYDDRAFARHRGARRVRHRDTLGRGATDLRGQASITRADVTARVVWLRLVGPHQDVCSRLTFGTRRVRDVCYIHRDGRHTWVGYYLNSVRHGKLRIRANWGHQIIDAIGFGR